MYFIPLNNNKNDIIKKINLVYFGLVLYSSRGINISILRLILGFFLFHLFTPLS